MHTVGIVFLLLFKRFEHLRLNNLTSKQIELLIVIDIKGHINCIFNCNYYKKLSLLYQNFYKNIN